MYQKRILPYIIIPYFHTPSFFPFGAFQTGRNTFGTCFGETGLKIRPDVLCHDNGEQKKNVLLCKMSPAFHFFLFEKGEKNNK